MPKYKGVYRGKNRNGKQVWVGTFIANKVKHNFGFYETERECAMAHDVYVLKKGIKRRTNFLKKKLV